MNGAEVLDVSRDAIWLWRALRRVPLWLLRPSADPLRLAKTRTWREVSARVLARRLRAIMAVDAREPLCALCQPVLYIASARDGIVPHHNLDEICKLRPSVQVVLIPGRHQAMYTHPEAASQAIVQFMLREGAA